MTIIITITVVITITITTIITIIINPMRVGIKGRPTAIGQCNLWPPPYQRWIRPMASTCVLFVMPNDFPACFPGYTPALPLSPTPLRPRMECCRHVVMHPERARRLQRRSGSVLRCTSTRRHRVSLMMATEKVQQPATIRLPRRHRSPSWDSRTRWKSTGWMTGKQC